MKEKKKKKKKWEKREGLLGFIQFKIIDGISVDNSI
jgi:hypothetical protein